MSEGGIVIFCDDSCGLEGIGRPGPIDAIGGYGVRVGSVDAQILTGGLF
jgi:hypothetical protein